MGRELVHRLAPIRAWRSEPVSDSNAGSPVNGLRFPDRSVVVCKSRELAAQRMKLSNPVCLPSI